MTHSFTSGVNNGINQNIDKLELRTFQYTNHSLLDLENDIDPENNFLSNINNDMLLLYRRTI